MHGVLGRNGLAALALVVAGGAAAQEQGPDQLTEVYRSWTVTCRTPQAAPDAAAPKRTCLMQQVISDTNSKAPLLNVTVARAPGGELAATFVTPFGIDLAKGIALQVDGGDTVTVPFKTCFQFGCVGTMALAGARRAALENGRELKVTLAPSDNATATFDLTVSLAGLTAALKRLEGLG